MTVLTMMVMTMVLTAVAVVVEAAAPVARS